MGSSNWLFSNTNNGAEVSRAMYTLAQNAKLNGINEMDYLWVLLDRIPSCSDEKDGRSFCLGILTSLLSLKRKLFSVQQSQIH